MSQTLWVARDAKRTLYVFQRNPQWFTRAWWEAEGLDVDDYMTIPSSWFPDLAPGESREVTMTMAVPGE